MLPHWVKRRKLHKPLKGIDFEKLEELMEQGGKINTKNGGEFFRQRTQFTAIEIENMILGIPKRHGSL